MYVAELQRQSHHVVVVQSAGYAQAFCSACIVDRDPQSGNSLSNYLILAPLLQSAQHLSLLVLASGHLCQWMEDSCAHVAPACNPLAAQLMLIHVCAVHMPESSSAGSQHL